MPSIDRSFRLRVFEYEEDWAVSGTPDIQWTFTDADIDVDSLTTFGGQIVRPLSGRVESRTWSMILLEGTNEAVTSKLADADGRANWLTRLAELQVNDDGGGWVTLITHRIVAVDDANEVGYKISFEDERLKERNAKIFTSANTTTVFPRGITPGVRQIRDSDGDLIWTAAYPTVSDSRFWSGQFAIVTWKVRDVQGPNVVVLEVWNKVDDFAVDVVHSERESRQFALDDRKPADEITQFGAFQYLRFHHWVGPSLAAGADYEITGFNIDGKIHADIVTERKLDFERPKLFWVAHGLVAGDLIRGFYYTPGRPPDVMAPLHIGYGLDTGSDVAFNIVEHSVDIGELIKRIYDGEFQDPASEITVIKYDTNALGAWHETTNPDGLINNPRLPSVGVGFRIMGSAFMYEWLEDNIYGPFQIVPFVQADGKVAPKLVSLPQADELTLGSLPDLSDATVSTEPAPSWSLSRKEIVTKITGSYIPEAFFWLPAGANQNTQQPTLQPFGFGDESIAEGGFANSLDRVFTGPGVELTRESDRITRYGISEQRYNLGMYHIRERADEALDFLAFQVFSRYTDGPQLTSLGGTFDSDTIKAGAYVKVSATAFPKLHETTPTRFTGTRIGQVIQVLYTQIAPNYLILDMGPSLQPLVTLTLSAIKNVTDGKWADLTIGNLTAGATYHVMMMEHPTASPTHQMGPWRSMTSGTANETITIKNLPTGRKVHFRISQFMSGRIGSAWSTIATVQLDGYVAPSGCAVSNVLSTTADLSWVNGDDSLFTVIELDGATRAVVGPGVARHTFTQLTPSTFYSAATVYHTDGENGISSSCNAGNFTTDVAPVITACTPVAPLVWKGAI